MNGHLHGTRKQQERADMQTTAAWWWVAVGIGFILVLALVGVAVTPILWAIGEVAFNAHPNPGAASIIVIYILGAIAVALIVVHARMKKPAKRKARKPLPPLPQEAEYMYIDTEGAMK